MKKLTFLYTALSLAVLCLTSCQKEEGNMTFMASLEASPNKTYLSSNGMCFNEGEKMIAYSWARTTNDGLIYTAIPNANNKLAEFTFDDQRNGSELPFAENEGPFVAFLGCNSWRACWTALCNDDGSVSITDTTDSFQHYYCPMVAKSNTNELKFKHLLGLVRVEYNIDAINSPGGYYLIEFPIGQRYQFRTAKVTWDVNGIPHLSDVTFAPDDWVEDEVFDRDYFFALPGTYSHLTFKYFTNHHIWEKTMASDASITVERAGITTIRVTFTPDDMRE